MAVTTTREKRQRQRTSKHRSRLGLDYRTEGSVSTQLLTFWRHEALVATVRATAIFVIGFVIVRVVIVVAWGRSGLYCPR